MRHPEANPEGAAACLLYTEPAHRGDILIRTVLQNRLFPADGKCRPGLDVYKRQDYNDVWFAGYTPYYTCTTWTGYDNNAKLSGKTGERNLAKTLWKAAMSKIHENLENKAFNVPADIVTATVCSQSGKLPIPGMCDETLKTEYFAKGTVPSDTCDVHYQGSICEYSGLPATELCPFQVPGTITMPPALDASLSGNANTTEEGTAVHCPHDATFMSDPNAAAVIAQQRMELDARNMLANYDIQMANLQAALQNAQTVLVSAQQQLAAAVDPDSQAAAQNAVNQAPVSYTHLDVYKSQPSLPSRLPRADHRSGSHPGKYRG